MDEQPYRVLVPPPPDPYALAWSDLKRRRLWLIGGIVWLGVALVMSDRSTGRPVAPLLMGLAMFALAIRCDLFRCPRCARLFGRKGLRQNAFARRCLHCDLEVGTPKDAVTSDAH